MTELLVSYQGLQTRVEARREDDVVWLEEFLLPWFKRASGTPDVTATLTYDDARLRALHAAGAAGGQRNVFRMDTRTVDLPCWNIPAQEYAVYDAHSRVFYLRRGCEVELVAPETSTDSRLA